MTEVRTGKERGGNGVETRLRRGRNVAATRQELGWNEGGTGLWMDRNGVLEMAERGGNGEGTGWKGGRNEEGGRGRGEHKRITKTEQIWQRLGVR